MERIILGSGKAYLTEYTGTIPEDATLETEANLFGLVSAGASLVYGKETYTAEDDLGIKKKTVITKETVDFNLGVCTIDGATIKNIVSTARVTEDATKHKRTVKIGGIGNDDGKVYLLRFVHADAQDGDIRVTLIGKNSAGLTLTFAKDKETIVNPVWKAEPMDNEGTLVIYEEEDTTIA